MKNMESGCLVRWCLFICNVHANHAFLYICKLQVLSCLLVDILNLGIVVDVKAGAKNGKHCALKG
jgi:hypothetical protein